MTRGAVLARRARWQTLAQSKGARIRYTNEPIGDPKVIRDFLPSPAELAFREEETKITITSSKRQQGPVESRCVMTRRSASADWPQSRLRIGRLADRRRSRHPIPCLLSRAAQIDNGCQSIEDLPISRTPTMNIALTEPMREYVARRVASGDRLTRIGARTRHRWDAHLADRGLPADVLVLRAQDARRRGPPRRTAAGRSADRSGRSAWSKRSTSPRR